MLALNIIIVLIPAVALYWFGLRPYLKESVTVIAMWRDGEPILVAFKEKLRGLKQRALTVGTAIFVTFITMWDYVAPYLTGVDMVQLLPQIPQWAWPIITAALLYLAQHFRDLAAKRAAQEEAEAADLAAMQMDVSAVVASEDERLNVAKGD